MSKRPSIEAAWQSYRQMVIPANATPGQLAECRRAFFAGASVLFHTLIRGASAGDEITDGDMDMMDAIQKEIDVFGASLDAEFTKRMGGFLQ